MSLHQPRRLVLRLFNKPPTLSRVWYLEFREEVTVHNHVIRTRQSWDTRLVLSVPCTPSLTTHEPWWPWVRRTMSPMLSENATFAQLRTMRHKRTWSPLWVFAPSMNLGNLNTFICISRKVKWKMIFISIHKNLVIPAVHTKTDTKDAAFQHRLDDQWMFFLFRSHFPHEEDGTWKLQNCHMDWETLVLHSKFTPAQNL